MEIIMKKRILLRCLSGALIGVALSSLITVAVSLAVGNGVYYAVTPELVSDFGGEMNAVLIQTFCAMLIGVVFSGASFVWEVERWSLLRMTLTHLIMTSAVMMPISWLLRWMPHSVAGVALYIAIFLGIYAGIWFSQYSAVKKHIKRLNDSLNAALK